MVNDGSSPTISNVEIIQTSFATTTIGIFNTNSAAPDISSTEVTVQGIGGYNYGVYNLAASPSIEDVKVKVMFGPIRNIAIRNDSSSAKLNNVEATATSSTQGASAIGLQFVSSGQPLATDSSFEATGTGTTIYGLEISSSSSSARIINSRIIGGVNDNAAGSTQCMGLYDANLGSIGC